MDVKKIKGFQNYYIHRSGYVFKRYAGKEIELQIRRVKTVPKVTIGHKKFNMIFLMIEYFGDKYIKYDDQKQFRFKYKLSNNRIDIDSIKIIEYNSSKHNDIRMFEFKCLEKANSANSRVGNISTISEGDVFDSLIRSNFKCSYCNKNLDPKIWELDHINPLSKTGLNTPLNITPSCKSCNRMKSNLDVVEFIHKCKMISNNFEDSEYLNNKTFNHNK